MNLFVLVAVVFVLFFSLAPRRAEATEGALCFSDANCGYQEICVKEHSWSPSGVCIKGSR